MTPDEVGDPGALAIETRVNGTVMQHSSTDQLIFDIPALIAYASAFTQLEAADVFATGSPHGVAAGRDPVALAPTGRYGRTRDRNVGILRNPVVAEA